MRHIVPTVVLSLSMVVGGTSCKRSDSAAVAKARAEDALLEAKVAKAVAKAESARKQEEKARAEAEQAELARRADALRRTTAQGLVVMEQGTGFSTWDGSGPIDTDAVVGVRLVAKAEIDLLELLTPTLPRLEYLRLDESTVPLTEGELQAIGRQVALKYLVLWRAPISPADLKHLAQLNELEHLNLGGTGLTTNVIPELTSLQTLRELHLEMLVRGDSGLEALAKFEKLEGLSLWRSEITDDDLAHLAACSRLLRLHLGKVAIGDEGLARLHGMKTLRFLDVGGTNVTDKGIQAFQEAVPECRVELQPDFVMPDALSFPRSGPAPAAVQEGR